MEQTQESQKINGLEVERDLTKKTSKEAPVPVPAPAPALVPPAKTPPQFELRPSLARAVQSGIQRINMLKAGSISAQQLFEQVAGTHQEFVNALIREAGMDPSNFPSYGLDETNGKFYLKAQ